MADDDILHAHFLEHGGGHLAGEGAAVVKVDILRADGHPGVLEQTDGAGDVDEGNAQYHIAPLVLAQQGLELLGEGTGLGQGLVHLPVAGDDGLTVFTIHGVGLPFYIYNRSLDRITTLKMV